MDKLWTECGKDLNNIFSTLGSAHSESVESAEEIVGGSIEPVSPPLVCPCPLIWLRREMQ